MHVASLKSAALYGLAIDGDIGTCRKVRHEHDSGTGNDYHSVLDTGQYPASPQQQTRRTE